MQKLWNHWKSYLITAFIVIGLLIIFNIVKTHINIYWKGFNDLLVFNTKLSNEVKIATIQLLVTFLASLVALWSYIRFKNKENTLNEKEHDDFVKIYVKSIINKRVIKIKTKIENHVNTNKRIKFAFLIISKKEIDFIETIENFINKKIPYTNNLEELIDYNEFALDNLAFIPMSYYYKENIGVGNEDLTFSHLLNTHKLTTGIYEVRFFVYSLEGHYHRSVQDVFFLSDKIKNKNYLIYPNIEPENPPKIEN